MFPLAALRHDRLRIAFRPTRALGVSIVERPGLELSPEACRDLVAECRTVARACLGDVDLAYGIFGPDPSVLDRCVVTVVRDATGCPVAFNALPLLEVDLGGARIELVHLGLVMVDPAHRGGGLSWILYGLTCFLLFARRQFRPLWLSSVTQVPAVVGMVAGTFDEVWPAQEGTRRSFAHVHLARQVMRDHRSAFGVSEDAGYDDARSVITDAYRGGSDGLKKTLEDAPPHRDPRYGEFCRTHLDYARGDDVLQVGQINFATARRFVAESVPRGSVSRLVGTVAVVALQALLAPVAQWMAAGRRLGRLRPRG